MKGPTVSMSDLHAAERAKDLIADHSADWGPGSRAGLVRRYLAGNHDLPYIPANAKEEYRSLAVKSRTPWLPLISDTFAKVLFVEGYRGKRGAANSAVWHHWQVNKLDARQTIVHRGALEYGAAYGSVLPGKGAGSSPAIRFYHPSRTYVVYDDPDAEWPVYALLKMGVAKGDVLYKLYDATHEYDIRVPKDSSRPVCDGSSAHGVGVTPFVRYRERLGDEDAAGIIAPLIPLQDRINDTVFALSIALQYASFRQRWATGMAVPTNDDGKPVEPFQSAVNRLWMTDAEGAKFGDFAQTETSGHLQAYQSAVRTLAAVAQTSPHALMGDLVNLGAEALASAEAATTRKSDEYATVFGESHEQLFKLAGRVAGDPDSADDDDAEVRWREREARSMASVVDALGKMAQMLQIPPQALWDRVPDTTDAEVERWRAAATSTDSLAALAEAMTRQVAPAVEGA